MNVEFRIELAVIKHFTSNGIPILSIRVSSVVVAFFSRILLNRNLDRFAMKCVFRMFTNAQTGIPIISMI